MQCRLDNYWHSEDKAALICLLRTSTPPSAGLGLSQQHLRDALPWCQSQSIAVLPTKTFLLFLRHHHRLVLLNFVELIYTFNLLNLLLILSLPHSILVP